ncbi:hypothetical protein HOO54_17785 [Bacillus sp. WMMC1349]|uniref:hypothetical protein n=1 Tax=Bacillus sp. WMMC1349 TaxID=2736254 RepID=UPI001557E8B1|nr:hypothetical protein [Bacillus sp. WMMC1349]NPC94018.1 hypothetical protein [Bacillus sp. WMMC1349]
MNYTLYITKAGDDRSTIYSYTLHNYKGQLSAGTFVAIGKRRNDDTYCGYIALQRALRSAAMETEGIVSLKIVADQLFMEPVIFEIIDVSSPLNPALCQTTKRLLKRFASYELAASNFSGDDASWQEVSTLDNALDELEKNKTIQGRWQTFCSRFFDWKKTIR